MRIGFYGGTFDPIHFGHLNAAFEMMEHYSLDQIWFCPANINPHKSSVKSVSSQHRVKMLELAIADISNFRVIHNELKRQGPSYTIDTLRELLGAFGNEKKGSYQLFLILGEDSLSDFFNWKEAREIIKIATPLVAKRSTQVQFSELNGDPEICEALKKGFTPTHFLDISASLVRSRIVNNQYIGHLVPAKVVDYIYQNQLYSI